MSTHDNMRQEMLSIAKLIALRRNPQYLTPKQMESLKRSISRDGFCAPVLVRPLNDKPGYYEIISGNHRVMAANEIGVKTIPCIVKDDMDDRTAKRLAINLNTVHGEPTAQLMAPFLAELDEDTLRDIHIEEGMREELLAFDKDLAKRLAELEVPMDYDRESPKHSTAICVCPSCGQRHRKKDASEEKDAV